MPISFAIVMVYSPSIADLSEFQYLLKYVKYLGPSWFKRFLARLIPSGTVQRLRKAVDDVEAESMKILAEKRAGLQGGDKEIAHGISEKKDVMSILRTYHRFRVWGCPLKGANFVYQLRPI